MPGSAQRKQPPNASRPSAYSTRLEIGPKRDTTRSTDGCAASSVVNAAPQKTTHTKAIAASSSVHAAGAPKTKRRTTCRIRLRNRTANKPAPTRSAHRDSRSPRRMPSLKRRTPSLDCIDALQQSPRPLLRELRLQVRRLHRLAECLDVRRRDLDTLRPEKRDKFLFLAHAVFVVELRRLGRGFLDRGLVLLRQGVPRLGGNGQLQHVHQMAGQHHLPGDFVELG